jgi:hypothetical protein
MQIIIQNNYTRYICALHFLEVMVCTTFVDTGIDVQTLNLDGLKARGNA